ncbi:hypothetical protein [Streptomyces sp. NPDC059349]|uniref:hypothetical protein n=1 Tax=Streptomyces sp. NPDC059349 TaxID=3346808 RepID=UPI0036CB9936
MLTNRRFVARGASPLEPGIVAGVEAVRWRRSSAAGRCSRTLPPRATSRALRKYFSHARAEAMRQDLRESFAAISRRADGGRLVSTFAQPVSEVMLSRLLRLPQEEIDRLRAMTQPTIGYVSYDAQDVELARAALARVWELEEWLAQRGRG